MGLNGLKAVLERLIWKPEEQKLISLYKEIIFS